jgi:predicted RNase H-like nuclease
VTAGLVGGLDGCAAGWVLVTAPAAGSWVGGAELDVAVLPHLDPVLAALESGRLAAVAIDIPIGLAAHGPRACDRDARRMLGPRRSSVFPAPVRSVLAASSYAEACEVSRAACGAAISKQLFNILAKIRDVDRAQTPRRQRSLFEMCPELSFAVLAGAPMRWSKRTVGGRAERVAALRSVFGEAAPPLDAPPPPGAKPDDVLDAMVGAWTARRYVGRSHIRLGGELDETGLRMEMIA